MSKKFWQSRTLWVNLFAAIALFAQNQWGLVFPPTVEVLFLLIINTVLRLVTKTELTA